MNLLPRKAKAKPDPIGELTPQQEIVLSHVDSAIAERRRLFILWYDAIRQGKSTGAAIAMLKHGKIRQGATYMVAAYTQRQVIAIFYPIFKHYAGLMGLDYHDVRGSSPYMEIDGNTYLVYGGRNEGQDESIQGLTLSGLLLDEYPLLKYDFVTQAEGRTSVNDALRIYTANKNKSPYHWSSRLYHQRAKKGELTNAMLFDSDVRTNQFVDDAFFAERTNEYDDLHAARFIENEFRLDRESLYVAQLDENISAPDITALYCEGNMISVLNAAYTDYGFCITESPEYTVTIPVSEMGLGDTVMTNTDRPMLVRTLRGAGKRVRAYRGDYEPKRVDYTQTLLNDGRLRVNKDQTALLEAMDQYGIAGIYPDGRIRALEMLGEYIGRKRLA